MNMKSKSKKIKRETMKEKLIFLFMHSKNKMGGFMYLLNEFF
jgi:hypothetical protein